MNNLKKAYDPESFRTNGHELIDLIANYLQDCSQQKIPVNKWMAPDDQLDFWKSYNFPMDSPISFFEDIIKQSIHVHHPKYIGHQVVPTAPLSALAHLLSGVLNNGMAIYEMGAASTGIEKVVVDLLLNKIGYSETADGFLTSGGTLANLTALLSARQNSLHTDIWKDGLTSQLGIMVSAEAHYCVSRAVRVMGMGEEGVVTVPVDKEYRMRTDLLEDCYQKAEASGVKVMAVVGSAPSTSTGMHDDLEAIAAFCASKKIWFHVDGAHGGAAVFSEKYKPLLKGIEQADSVVIDGHKMLMTPGIMTFLLFKNKVNSYTTFSQKAQYLWAESEGEEWYNLAKRTFECTKEMMSVKFFVLWKMYGEEVFDEFVTHLYDLGKLFADKIQSRENFELAVIPETNIVCFRLVQPGMTATELNGLNSNIRQQLLEDGNFYIVQTLLNEIVYLRLTIMNIGTDAKVMEALLEEIICIESKIRGN